MEFASFLKLLSKTDGFGCGFFVFGCFSQIFNLVFLFCLLLLGLKFLLFKGSSLFVQYLEKIYRISPKIECCNSFDREHTLGNNNNGFVAKSCFVDELDQKIPIILHRSTDSADGDGLRSRRKMNKSSGNCDLLLLHDGLGLSKNRDGTAALSETDQLDEESEEEESRSRIDEDQVFDVITLREMVKRERKRGDCMMIELEKERRAAESAAEEAMAMLLKLRMEKSVVELEAKHYKRVAEQKQVYDQEVIQSLQWMLMMKLDDERRF